jgi:hypothetical protein
MAPPPQDAAPPSQATVAVAGLKQDGGAARLCLVAVRVQPRLKHIVGLGAGWSWHGRAGRWHTCRPGCWIRRSRLKRGLSGARQAAKPGPPPSPPGRAACVCPRGPGVSRRGTSPAAGRGRRGARLGTSRRCSCGPQGNGGASSRRRGGRGSPSCEREDGKGYCRWTQRAGQGTIQLHYTCC